MISIVRSVAFLTSQAGEDESVFMRRACKTHVYFVIFHAHNTADRARRQRGSAGGSTSKIRAPEMRGEFDVLGDKIEF